MSEKSEKIRNGIIMQGSILAIAGLIARAIGIIRRIPLTNIIGDAGNGYYSVAYEVYSIILLLSSYSLPLAVSKLVAARVSRGQYKNADRIFKGALMFAVISGGFACFFVLIFADWLAGTVMGQPMSAIGLRFLAPTLLIVAIMGVFRGYFQGLNSMTPTAISQIIEQVFLVIFSLLFADLFFGKGASYSELMLNDQYGPAWGAAGATIGCGIGALAGLIFLVGIFLLANRTRKKKLRKDLTKVQENYSGVIRVILLTIIPVILSTVVYNLCGIIDQGIYNHHMNGLGLEELKTINWGIYSGKYKVLINLPIALASAMCSALVPSLTANISNQNKQAARDKIGSAIRVTMLVTIPCAVGLSVLGKPIISMLWPDDNSLAAKMLLFGTLSIVFYALSTLGNGILQGINKLHIPIINALIALVLHLVIYFIMLKGMDLDIFAVIYANIFFSLIMCLLNHLAIYRYIGYHQEFKRTFFLPIVCSALMGAICFGAYHLIRLFAPDNISCIIAIIIAVVVYFIAMILLKGCTKAELSAIPVFGKFLAKLLR